MFPTNSERLIGISNAFCAFCLRVSVIFPTCSLYPQQKRAYPAPHPQAWTDIYIYIYRPCLINLMAMPVGIYRVQSPGFPKIVYCEGQSHKTVSTEHVGTPKQRYNTEVRSDIHPANRSFSLEERKKSAVTKGWPGLQGGY